MAYTAVLERETVKEKETKQREISLAEAKHTANRHEAYMRSFGPSATATQVIDRPVDAPVRERRVETTSSENTITLSPAQKNRALFMDLDYRDGMLINRNTEARVDVLIKSEAPAATVAPVAPVAAVAPVVEAVTVPAPAQTEDDDAIPTRRTMETLRQSTATKEVAAEDERVGFFAALSTKTKLVLLAIVTAVVLALVIICVNTAIINSINADITNLRGKVDEQQATYAALNEEIESLENPASETVSQWAQEHGMTREP